ncbi:hypothetical protein LAG90_09140 [Marinilongibacter aquaticus]|uniref:hypothetical protein n=1 Tax=Marinilongibacter aquaticus TaxID=2975157 RepID=UPI0021BDDE38|nr:hypothetical protein [Marinilongibacter aquaticus]UBM60799.1 hypothetical protein LAG90_09140 [Marinilongibacter aquaticus]
MRSPLKIEPIAKFYKENEKNAKFFINRRGEYSVAAFLRNTLMADPFMREGKEVSEIIEYCSRTYHRDMKSQELSRELRRLHQKGVLFGKDKFGNGAIYLYSTH